MFFYVFFCLSEGWKFIFALKYHLTFNKRLHDPTLLRFPNFWYNLIYYHLKIICLPYKVNFRLKAAIEIFES